MKRTLLGTCSSQRDFDYFDGLGLRRSIVIFYFIAADKIRITILNQRQDEEIDRSEGNDNLSPLLSQLHSLCSRAPWSFLWGLQIDQMQTIICGVASHNARKTYSSSSCTLPPAAQIDNPSTLDSLQKTIPALSYASAAIEHSTPPLPVFWKNGFCVLRDSKAFLMLCCGFLRKIGLINSRVALRWKCQEGSSSSFGLCPLEFQAGLKEILRLILYCHFETVAFLGDQKKKSQKVDMMALGHLPQWLGTQASQTSSMIHSKCPPFHQAIL